MGQHTWFYKDIEVYHKVSKIYQELENYEREKDYGNSEFPELEQLENELNDLIDSNDAEYHDLFRTNKRNDDKTYYDGIITSREECFEFIENPNNHCSFANTYDYNEMQVTHNVLIRQDFHKKHTYKLLNEFWDKYPNGVIDFG